MSTANNKSKQSKPQRKSKDKKNNEPAKKQNRTIINLDKTDIIAILSITIFFSYIYFSNISAYDSLMYDEAGYITMGRTLAVEHYHGIDVQGTKESYRQPLFPMMIALGFMLFGISYTTAKISIIASSILTMIAIYLAVSRIYDKKMAFFSAAFFGSIPLTLQYTENILSDIPSVLFYTVSMLAFYLAIEKDKPKHYYIGWFSFGLAFLIRYNAVLIIPSVGLYLLLKIATHQTTIRTLVKDRNFMLSPLASMIPLLPYFIYQQISFGDAFIGLRSARGALNMPWGAGPWHTYLTQSPEYLTTIGFALTILGISWTLYKKDKFAIYNIIWALIPLVYFSAQLLKDIRLIATMAPSLAIFASIGIFKVISTIFSRDLKIDSETVSLSIASILLIATFYSGYTAITPIYSNVHALGYKSLENAGIWIKENTPKDAVLMTASQPGHQWYSYRKTTSYPKNETLFIQSLKEGKADYIIIDNYERMQPQYAFDVFKKAFLNENNNLKHTEDSGSIKLFYEESYGFQTIVIPRDLYLQRLEAQ